MNKQIIKLNEFDKQIDFLKKEINSKSFLASGITIDITIGAKGSGRVLKDIQVSFLSGIEEELLNLILKAVISSREYCIKVAQEELNEISNYLK